jgi:tRNA-splicing ligase RtcB
MIQTNTHIGGDSTNAEVMLPESELEEGVIDQIQTMIDHEAFQNDVAIMPDTHVGSGAVIGFTMPLGDRVVPNTIGVDIGCGMYAANFGKVEYDEETLRKWDREIRDKVPMGFSVYDDQDYYLGNDFPWQEANEKLTAFSKKHDFINHSGYNLDYFKDLCNRVGCYPSRAINSVGTLGGGNHFIELGESEKTGLWCIIHSGSRGLGLKVAQHHQERAVELRSAEKFSNDVLPDGYEDYATDELKPKAEKIRDDFEGQEIGQVFDVISQARQEATEQFNDDLAYLEDKEAHQYFVDMIFSQMYASESRKVMMSKVAEVIGRCPAESIESVHNFIDFEDLTIRKGATRAGDGEVAVVPFNMKDGTLLVEGKGNDNWNNSAPHGAGRVMSRTQAYDDLSVEDFEEQMSDVVSSSVNEETLDEAPGAYKKADLIEDAIAPTAEVIDRIQPVLNLKAE